MQAVSISEFEKEDLASLLERAKASPIIVENGRNRLGAVVWRQNPISTSEHVRGTMGRAFSPQIYGGRTWGCAPGWYVVGPLALSMSPARKSTPLSNFELERFTLDSCLL